MKKIELNHWYIKDNCISISLMNMHVSIKPIITDSIFWLATFTSGDMKETYLKFDTLEDAIEFIETNKNMRNKEDIKILSKNKK